VSPVSEAHPPLDCHAHIAPDVTPSQVAGLDGAQVFAMTRSLDEARFVADRQDPGLVWSLGVHPASRLARDAFDAAAFASLLDRFALVGEVGLDRRGGDLETQQRVFDRVLAAAAGQPVLLSVHSTGAIDAVLDLLATRPHPGVILHWFTGDESRVDRAAALGCYFSVNAAMTNEQITSLPRQRVLPETDFPSSRQRTKALRPGGVLAIEARLKKLWPHGEVTVRRQLYRNLRDLAIASRAIDRLPSQLVDLLIVA
jgi:TatD DNase family protein